MVQHTASMATYTKAHESDRQIGHSQHYPATDEEQQKKHIGARSFVPYTLREFFRLVSPVAAHFACSFDCHPKMLTTKLSQNGMYSLVSSEKQRHWLQNQPRTNQKTQLRVFLDSTDRKCNELNESTRNITENCWAMGKIQKRPDLARLGIFLVFLVRTRLNFAFRSWNFVTGITRRQQLCEGPSRSSFEFESEFKELCTLNVRQIYNLLSCQLRKNINNRERSEIFKTKLKAYVHY